jgi:hypothetical protein
MTTDESLRPRAAGAISPEPMGDTVGVDQRGPLARTIDTFIDDITAERIADIIDGYDPSDHTYVFLEGPRWSTKTGERVAFGWGAFTDSPIRMRDWSWAEGPFEFVEGTLGWIAGVIDLNVTVGERAVTIRLRGTYVMRLDPPTELSGPISASLRVPPVGSIPTGKPDRDPNDQKWRIIHEHFSQPLADPYGMGDWLPKQSEAT